LPEQAGSFEVQEQLINLDTIKVKFEGMEIRIQRVDINDPGLFKQAPTLIHRYTPVFLEKVQQQRKLSLDNRE